MMLIKTKRKFPIEWRAIIKNAKMKHATIAAEVGISEKKLSNIYYGIIYVPEDIYQKLESIVEKIKPKRIDKTSFVGRIVKILCRICGEWFVP
jgi:uncharacterized membrane protein